MFSTKRRMTATLLIVCFLVASLGVFVPQTEAQAIYNCTWYQTKCCQAIFAAKIICATFGSGSDLCSSAQSAAGYACAVASNVCNSAFSCS